jgi:hypothetical protein
MDSGPHQSSKGRPLVTESESEGDAESSGTAARTGSRRRWLWMAGGLWLLGAALVFFLHGFLLDTIVAQAERRGVVLSGCRLDLGLASVGLEGCAFAARPDGRVFSAGLAGMAVHGTAERIEVGLAGLRPVRAHVHGARAALVGEPRLAQLRNTGAGFSTTELPIGVSASTLAWQLEEGGAPAVLLSDIAFDTGTNRLGARFEVVRRAHGQLTLGPEGIEVTLGDPARPEVRLIARVLPKAQRVDVSLDLRRFPLRILEGSWLQMTDTLRPLEVEGRIFASVPLGLSMEVPSGDLHLSLHTLQFPVPREIEGLVYQSAPKLSGKFTLSRAFDRMSIADLSFLTGELAMRGDAELELSGRGVTVKARASGPLSCRAIAEAAAVAHADSALGALVGRFARRVLSGSVEVLSLVEGHSSDLEHARVLTSIGVGCGLEPLPLDSVISKELLDRLPIDVLEHLPRFGVEAAEPTARPRPARPKSPGLLPLFDKPSPDELGSVAPSR